MIVEDNRRTTMFDELEHGDVFIYEEEAFMVLDYAKGENWNAVRLWDGQRREFHDSAPVHKVHAKVVIE